MCEGTELDDTPWVCVKVFGLKFTNHPKFSDPPKKYEFAVAVLEGKPVFVGDRIYAKSPNSGMCCGGIIIIDNDGIRIEFENKTSFHIEIFSNAPIDQYFTWQPSTPKRTFTLNGVELPRPFNMNSTTPATVPLSIGCRSIWFCSEKDKNSVEECIVRILEEARDKP
jgi:hypothetical protein